MKRKLPISVFVIMGACLFLGVWKPASADPGYAESGFLQDYSMLSPDPERPSVRMYLPESTDPNAYDKIMIGEIEFFLHPDSEYQGISPGKIEAVTDEFRKYLQENLGKRRTLVTEPGEGVLILSMAITNVYAKRPKRSVLTFTPIGLAATSAKKAAGIDYALATAALEAEVRDGQSGEVIAALVGTELGEKLASAKTGERDWDDIQADLKAYADTLRDRFGGRE